MNQGEIAQKTIYTTKISKYGLSFLLFLLDDELDYKPNILVRYNNLYLCSRFHKHLTLGYCIEPQYVCFNEEATILSKQSLIYDENLGDMYNAYYNVYKDKEFSNPKPRIYDILTQDIVFNKGWFEYEDDVFVVAFNRLLFYYQPIGISGMIELFVALRDLNCSYCFVNHAWSSMASWAITNQLFKQLPMSFTINDVIPFVSKDVENRAYQNEQLWRDVAEQHKQHKDVIIPIVSKKNYREIGRYIEKPTKYGIYHGEYLWYD